MLKFFTLPYVLGSLLVLGVAQACFYYVYLESPYDYWDRYCKVGCVGMNNNDENFNQCCLPMTSGQTTPAVCATLSASCAAAGTVCPPWGSGVPTSNAPSTSGPPASYTPPAYKPRDVVPSTETVWVTETSTTPCASPSPTTNNAAVPTTSAPEECDCEGEDQGETSNAAAVPTGSAPAQGDAPSAGVQTDNRRRRRGLMIRDKCVCPTSTSASSVPSTTAPPPVTSNAAVPTSSSQCVCPTGSAPGQGDAAPEGFQGDRRDMGSNGECSCPGETGNAAVPTTSSSSSTPPTTTSSTPEGTEECECDCEEEGKTSNAAIPTGSTPVEGDTPSQGVSTDNRRRRGLKVRGGECVCPTSSSAAVPSTGNAAAPTTAPTEPKPCECAPSSSAPGEGSAPSRRGFMVRDNCVCPTTGNAAIPTTSAPGEGNANPDYSGSDNRKRNAPPSYFVGDKKSQLPGENFKFNKREVNPTQTVTSTTTITTDDCAMQTAPTTGETSVAAVPTTSAAPSPTGSAPSEGDINTTFIGGDNRKRSYGRWRGL
ncbi:uncharacterized protein I206_106248 [Kwoniella pini CBS 10737]|uniref:CBM1 domain-containing protein n=1 Tax=Kwoniella pini CBS 10737 TaxID=1296096 RepID=A0A1B9I1P8_9TREE|nr:uncharacterized protein I206_05074 [Kwoniella pini CBS 10737]OCF49381.1 hypothetical protein I206_05074 [Kwoniella pini CBS 10737]